MSGSISIEELEQSISSYRISGQGRIDISNLADILVELLSPNEVWDLVRQLSQRTK